ncbi:hypothetical protein T484DRAFT_3271023 [Baffinella frigidus]|nr:hypothetical protein T484DRAFT_3271023 [Cryptophyta sp. CCMP2293]
MVKTKGAKNKEPREAGTPYDLKQTAKEEAVEAGRKRSQPTLLQLFGKKDSAITHVPQASGSSSTASSVAISSQDPGRKLVVVHFPVSGKLPSITVISNGKWGQLQRASPDLWIFQPQQRDGEEEEDWRRRCIPLREGGFDRFSIVELSKPRGLITLDDLLDPITARVWMPILEEKEGMKLFAPVESWEATDPGTHGHVWIGFEPIIHDEGQSKLVLESEVELLQLARENVEALWADEDEEDEGEGDEERDEL